MGGRSRTRVAVSERRMEREGEFHSRLHAIRYGFGAAGPADRPGIRALAVVACRDISAYILFLIVEGKFSGRSLYEIELLRTKGSVPLRQNLLFVHATFAPSDIQSAVCYGCANRTPDDKYAAHPLQ